MLADLRYALRGFRRSPAFTIVAVVSLALGIGANTAVFSLVNAVLLRTLPVPEPDRLVIFALSQPDRFGGSNIPLASYRQLRDHNTTLQGFAAFTGAQISISGSESTEHVDGLAVSGNYFSTLGVSAALGRVFTDADEQNGLPVCVIGYGFWMRRFGGDTRAIGSTIQSDGTSFTILGVTPKAFSGLFQGSQTDISILLTQHDGRVSTFGRLKAGVTRMQAQASLDALFQHVGGNPPSGRFGKGGVVKVVLEPGAHGFVPLRQKYERPLILLMIVSGLVLLIASANIANLLMARASNRTKEIAVRLALGAGRGRLIRQLLAESMALTMTGALGGVILAFWFDPLIVALAPRPYGPGPLLVDVNPDWRVLLFTMAVAIWTCVLAGLAPAVQSTHPEMGPALKGEKGMSGPGRFSFTNALVVAQVSLSLALLIGAGLFLRSLRNLRHVDIGFEPERLVVLTVEPRTFSPSYFDSLLERARRIPGVVSVSPGLISPLSGDFSMAGIQVPGYQRAGNEPPLIPVNWIGPDYFRTIGARLVSGRSFTLQDRGEKRVAVMNEKSARHYWPNQDPIGKHVRVGGRDPQDYEIVGVVRDVRSESLREDAQPAVYLPFSENRRAHVTLHVRVAGDAKTVIAALLREVHALDPAVPTSNAITMAAQIDRTIALDRLLALLTALFGALAVVLAAVGLYGVMAFTLAARTREIGIRMALGAGRARVLSQVMGESAVLIAIGIALGIPLAIWASRGIASLLFGLSATDFPTYASLALLLAAIALSAAWIPARRAALVDPMVALRYE